jgi:hypothetical protein
LYKWDFDEIPLYTLDNLYHVLAETGNDDNMNSVQLYTLCALDLRNFQIYTISQIVDVLCFRPFEDWNIIIIFLPKEIKPS